MFCGLGEKERTKFRKKKKEIKEKRKKKRKKAHCSQKWVGWNERGYLQTYNHVKYFLPYLSRF